MNAFDQYEVWFVTGAQLLYGGDAVYRQRCAAVPAAVQFDRERDQVQPHGRFGGGVCRAGRRPGGNPRARYRPGHCRGVPGQHLSAVFPRG